MNDNSLERKTFINRLKAIVEANLQDEKFGVNELAIKMGLSRSQIHRKLKSICNKSISQFIREVRLDKAKELLKQGKLTVSEIAYKVGFGSPSYFIKSFHDYFGYPPGEYLKYANSDREKDLNAISNKPEVTKTRKSLKWFVSILIVISALVSIYFMVQNRNKEEPVEKSIAILPLKILSNNPEIQYLADGIMEDILIRLSHIDGLVVKSRISSEKGGDGNLTAKEIAKELNVSYFLEGSILPDNNKIRINVQLINAKEDKHMWANNFDNDLTEILPFITEVSSQICEELKIILTPEEKEQVEKLYTENKKAYNLYIEGRFYFQLRTKESFEKSIELYNQALALDSNFCLAYAGLADSYLTSTWYKFIPPKIGIPISNAYALKALKIDNNIAEVHATLGGIAATYYYDYDWDTAEKEFKKALKINPGYARGLGFYSEYMDVIGNSDMARQYIDKAHLLNPSDHSTLWVSHYYYIKEGNYNKALEESNKIFTLNKNEIAYHRRNFMVYLYQHKIPKAVDAYKKYWHANYPNNNTDVIEKIYMESGKEGFIKFVVNSEKRVSHAYPVSYFYALINEKDSALFYLEKSFERGDVYLPRIKYDPAFKNLKTDPRFKNILRQMNLADD